MNARLQTPLFAWHVDHGAQMVEFGGWDMPVQYPKGIVQEHLATRSGAGLFDVAHMGRFTIRGPQAEAFLQRVLSNDARSLTVGRSHYTLIPDEDGGAIDDAYLYRFVEDEYLLVVNAANRDKDWSHLQAQRAAFKGVQLEDRTEDLSMFSLQGPHSQPILESLLAAGRLPDPRRNALSRARIGQADVLVARTGYTGEPFCFELFVARRDLLATWERLAAAGAQPVGLGARDTLRLEASLPLYGHELGLDPEGRAIPIFAVSLARFGVSLAEHKEGAVGHAALVRQAAALDRPKTAPDESLPRRVRSVALIDKGVARAGFRVFQAGRPVGFVTSGTAVPYWEAAGDERAGRPSENSARRSIGLALLDSDLDIGAHLDIEIRNKSARAVVVPHHLRSDAPPYARAVLWNQLQRS